jgi:hypothetical protein
MQLEYAFCANYAETGEAGTVSVIGAGINVLRVATLPAQVRSLYVIARVTFAREERGRPYELEIDLLGPEGKRLSGWPLVAPMLPAAQADPPEVPSAATCITALTAPVFTHPGEYRFQFSAAGQVLGSTSFWVHPTPDGDARAVPAERRA